jgi:hypothetical protein
MITLRNQQPAFGQAACELPSAQAPATGLITRRTALCLASFLGWTSLSRAMAAHFWDSKPASLWSPEEIAELTANSPWAKQVSAQYRVAMDSNRPPPGSELQQGRGEAKVGECGLVPCGSIMPGKVAVIWESAQPVREAIHPAIPPELNGRYVISIRGLEGEYPLDRLEAGSDLSAKGKSPVRPGPGMVRRRNNTILFSFSKELLPLEANDKDVQFNVRTGANLTNTLVHATFNPKDMIYRGTLAL